MNVIKKLANAGLDIIDGALGIVNIAAAWLQRAHDFLSGIVNDLKMD